MNEDKIDTPASVDLGLGVSLHLLDKNDLGQARYSVRIKDEFAREGRPGIEPPFDVLLVGDMVGVIFKPEQGEEPRKSVWESLPITGLGDHNRLAATLKLLARAYARGRGYRSYTLGAERIRLDDFDRQIRGLPPV